ncbi:hypothetical protein PVAP13_9NG730077 [Panicum virgatum]|uniref:Uncharacterized protein n=1 Tax=Panicum virgatum TaxID=38727 RepID=A0A8T0N2Q1_PANVG|nr:hypothetical protein PVAP13_9NG730077 [Panicum virgatum]
MLPSASRRHLSGSRPGTRSAFSQHCCFTAYEKLRGSDADGGGAVSSSSSRSAATAAAEADERGEVGRSVAPKDCGGGGGCRSVLRRRIGFRPTIASSSMSRSGLQGSAALGIFERLPDGPCPDKIGEGQVYEAISCGPRTSVFFHLSPLLASLPAPLATGISLSLAAEESPTPTTAARCGPRSGTPTGRGSRGRSAAGRAPSRRPRTRRGRSADGADVGGDGRGPVGAHAPYTSTGRLRSARLLSPPPWRRRRRQPRPPTRGAPSGCGTASCLSPSVKTSAKSSAARMMTVLVSKLASPPPGLLLSACCASATALPGAGDPGGPRYQPIDRPCMPMDATAAAGSPPDHHTTSPPPSSSLFTFRLHQHGSYR